MTLFASSNQLLRGWRKNLAVLTLILVGAFAASGVQAQFVRAEGTSIVDGDGNPLYLRGMNLGNWLLWEGYLMMGDFNYRTHTQFLESLAQAFGGNMAQAREFEHQWRLHYVTEQAIIDLKNLGFNSVRVPFHYNMFWQNGQLSDHGFQYIDRLIEWCTTHQVYILLDMHAAPGYQNPGDHSDNMDSNASQPRHTVRFWDGDNVAIASQVWRHIADRYKDEPIIWGYDLINEPVLQDGREYELLPSLIAMRNAIREVDNNHIIVAQGHWWASQDQYIDWMEPATQAATGVTQRWDDNLVYQTHHYVFGNPQWVPDLFGRVDRTNKLGVPLILGEYGEDTNNIIRQMTDWSIDNIAGHFPWSFKKMSHDRTLWTIPPNNVYNQVVNAINNGTVAPPGSYEGMIAFAQNNIANGSPGIQWHQGFYDAVKTEDVTPPAGCGSASYQGVGQAIDAVSFCAMHGIQTEPTSDQGGGENVGWTSVGDWLDYNINVPQTGTYTLTYRVASTANTGEIQLLDQSGSTLAATSLPNTGGWQTWTSVSTEVALAAGQQTLRLYVAGAGFNLNWFRLELVVTDDCSGNGQSIPGRVDAVDFCAMAGVQTEPTSDVGGGENVGWLEAGDWMDYRITVPSTGNYTLHYRVSSPVSSGEVQFRSGANTLATSGIPNTGGWQNWTTISETVPLSAGSQTVRLHIGGGAFNINWFELTATSSGGDIANGVYSIVSAGSGLALRAQNRGNSNGANVVVGNAQQWQVTSLGNGEYRIDHVISGRTLDVAGVSADNGANIHLWSYVGGNNQRWRIEPVSGNDYRIISVHSDRALDVQDGSSSSGANIQQWEFHGGPHQLWRFQ